MVSAPTTKGRTNTKIPALSTIRATPLNIVSSPEVVFLQYELNIFNVNDSFLTCVEFIFSLQRPTLLQ